MSEIFYLKLTFSPFPGDPNVGGVHGVPPHHPAPPPPHIQQQQHPQQQQSNGNNNIDLGAVYQQTVENRVTK